MDLRKKSPGTVLAAKKTIDDSARFSYTTGVSGAMDKRLTEDEFNIAIESANVGPQTREIAYGVLVLGRPQTEFVERFKLTKGAVSQAVNRVFKAAQKSKAADPLPPGYEVVTAILPEAQAFQVKKWAKAAEPAIKGKRRKDKP